MHSGQGQRNQCGATAVQQAAGQCPRRRHAQPAAQQRQRAHGKLAAASGGLPHPEAKKRPQRVRLPLGEITHDGGRIIRPVAHGEGFVATQGHVAKLHNA